MAVKEIGCINGLSTADLLERANKRVDELEKKIPDRHLWDAMAIVMWVSEYICDREGKEIPHDELVDILENAYENLMIQWDN